MYFRFVFCFLNSTRKWQALKSELFYSDLVLMIKKSGVQQLQDPSSAQNCITKSSTALIHCSTLHTGENCTVEKCRSAKVQSSDAVSIAKVHPTKLLSSAMHLNWADALQCDAFKSALHAVQCGSAGRFNNWLELCDDALFEMLLITTEGSH